MIICPINYHLDLFLVILLDIYIYIVRGGKKGGKQGSGPIYIYIYRERERERGVRAILIGILVVAGPG
jgi:hypothetical protein